MTGFYVKVGLFVAGVVVMFLVDTGQLNLMPQTSITEEIANNPFVHEQVDMIANTQDYIR